MSKVELFIICLNFWLFTQVCHEIVTNLHTLTEGRVHALRLFCCCLPAKLAYGSATSRSPNQESTSCQKDDCPFILQRVKVKVHTILLRRRKRIELRARMYSDTKCHLIVNLVPVSCIVVRGNC